jgi:hypothetical protein
VPLLDCSAICIFVESTTIEINISSYQLLAISATMTIRKTRVGNNLYDSLLNGCWTTIILTFFFLYFISGKCSTAEMLVAVPFFVFLYFTQFVIGRDAVIRAFQEKTVTTFCYFQH